MSYTAGLESTIAKSETTIAPTKKVLAAKELSENPTAIELFSYAVCCAAQGLLWAFYLVVLLSPFAIRQGILSNLF